MPRVEGKVAIVTGAASGLGLASSKKLIQEGARVVLTDINQQSLETIKEHFKEFSETQYSTEYLDVTSEESWQEIIEKVELFLSFKKILLFTIMILFFIDSDKIFSIKSKLLRLIFELKILIEFILKVFFLKKFF